MLRSPFSRVLLFALLSGCSSVSFQPEVGAIVNAVDRARLQADVLALANIGPRPVSDVAATRATIDFLSERLLALGYEVEEEVFEFELTGNFVAIVRPIDQPDAEPIDLPLAADLSRTGSIARQAQALGLAQKGWKVEGYKMVATGESQIFRVPNLIATQRGMAAEEEILELSAHYDTVPSSPGADDNATGVAALLEIARVVAQVPTQKTIRLCFFGAEEVGLRGSQVHLERISTERVGCLINLDGVGFTEPGAQREPDELPWFLSFPDRGDFLVVVGKWSSGWLGNLVEDAIDVYASDLPYYSANRIGACFRDGKRSDHANYWEAGIPAVFLSDTGEFRGGHYHRPSDTPQTLDYAFLESVTRAVAAASLHWVKLEPQP